MVQVEGEASEAQAQMDPSEPVEPAELAVTFQASLALTLAMLDGSLAEGLEHLTAMVAALRPLSEQRVGADWNPEARTLVPDQGRQIREEEEEHLGV
jgi:hypothetical protein